MHILKDLEISRREMMSRTGQLAITGSAASYALGLAGIAEASAFNDDGDYKALVCVFLQGGNDHNNTLVPFDPVNHALYSHFRKGIATPRENLAATVLRTPDGQRLTNDIQYALSPALPRLKRHFDQGNLAVLLNVGPLIAPLTQAQYMNSNTTSFPRPAKLFSHNDQQSTWQSFGPEGQSIGWGGRICDLAMSANTNAMFSAINASGNAVFLSGRNTVPIRVGTNGLPEAAFLRSGRVFDSRRANFAMREILACHHGHVFEQDYMRMTDRSVRYGGFLNNALEQVQIATPFPVNNPLATQLQVVARAIAARRALGVRRQVFLVSISGFDAHQDLLASHGAQLARVDEAIDAFYGAMVGLGVEKCVTTFTASDFGRTLASNGDGSDHGWGGHHFILGGDVNGGRFYGNAPMISTSSPDQVGGGRLLPTTSVDEYSTTLALWMGVAWHELASVAPNIWRFANPNLGFMTRPQVPAEPG